MRKDMPAQSRVDIEALGYVSDLNPMSGQMERKYKGPMVEYRIHDDTAGYEKMLKLRDRLLAIDGESACLPDIEEDYDNIMTYGQLWIGQKKIKMMKARHANVIGMYASCIGPTEIIRTGFCGSLQDMHCQKTRCGGSIPGWF